MKTFTQFILEYYTIVESSTGEKTRGRATLARGRGSDMTRYERSTAAIAKKAGMRGTGKYSTKDLRTRDRSYSNDDSRNPYREPESTKQDTSIRTYSSPRKAAVQSGIISKKEYIGGLKSKHVSSANSVRKTKDFKKALIKAGSNRRGKVHDVSILPRGDAYKDDPKRRMERGKNFIQAVKDTPKHLKKAGARKNEAVMGEPAAVLYKEKKDTGAKIREKLYKKVFGKKSSNMSNKTNKMVGEME